jgi:lysozyme
MLYGVDLHPTYQAGISIPQIHSEGFDFLICKMSQGTTSKSYAGSIPWLQQARSQGMQTLGYHYLTNGNPEGQAKVFTDALKAAGVAGAIDVEKGSGDIDNVHAFYNECESMGCRIALLYLPQWYWKQIGSPAMQGLPPLWSSRYPDMVLGTAMQNYQKVPHSYWDGYGGLDVAVLQFSSTSRVAGHTVDANAFNGTYAELATLLSPNGTALSAKEEGFLMALNDAEQEELLGLARTIDAQIRGQAAAGWQTYDGGTNEALTMVDYLRRNNVEVENVRRDIAALAAKEVATQPVGTLDHDELVAAVTDAVMNSLTKVKFTVPE